MSRLLTKVRPPPSQSSREPAQGGARRRRAAGLLAMTALAIGPWAWAELGDPPAGEPLPALTSEGGPQPPVPPAPPTPPAPPLPPLPPGPPLPDVGLYLPPFAWHDDRPLLAVWDADLKVSEPLNAGSAGGCVVGEWPLPTQYNAAGWTMAGPLPWQLNDPLRTLELMDVNGISLYLHDARMIGPAGKFDTSFPCDWVSIAALDDAITVLNSLTLAAPLPHYTGLIMGNFKEGQTVLLHRDDANDVNGILTAGGLEDPSDPADGRAFCAYRGAVARARAEAADHPDTHKLVIVDELTQSLRSPLVVWSGQTNTFGAPEVELLHRLATEAPTIRFNFGSDYELDTARYACDAAFDAAVAQLDSQPGPSVMPVAEDDLPFAVGGGNLVHPAEAPVELWTRVNAAAVPLHIVPSVLVGYAGGVARDDVSVGATTLARWSVTPAVTVADHAFHRVKLRALVTPYVYQNRVIELWASLNGVELPASQLVTAPSSAPVRYVERENIYMMDVVLADNFALGGGSDPHDWLDGGENTIDLGLKLTAAPPGDEPVVAADMAASFFGAQVIYEDVFGNVIAAQPLKVEDASFLVRDAAGAEGPCSAAMLCTTNAAYRIDHLLDGLTIAQDITVPWPEAGAPGVPDLQLAWSEFVAYSCDRFARAKGPGGARNRCLVDERAWGNGSAEVDSFNVGDAMSRLRTGVERGDGSLVLWFTLELEDMFNFSGPTPETRGRFGVREPNTPDFPYLANLPALTRNILGEGIVWEVAVADVSDPTCLGDWTVTWQMPSCPAKWTYGPVGEVANPDAGDGIWIDRFQNQDAVLLDPVEDRPFYQLLEDSQGLSCDVLDSDQSGSYTINLPATSAGQLRFGWEIKDDDDPAAGSSGRVEAGDNGNVPQYVEMHLAPPPGCSSMYTVSQAAVVDSRVEGYFLALVDYLASLGDGLAGDP